MDLISVIVPVYKVEEYLDQCVSSIVNQTYQNLEIILVDDGSPDSCPAMCDRWAEKDPRIKVIHKENGGLSDARNAGLKVATGEYVAFVDSDDWIDPDMYSLLYERIRKSESDISSCGVQRVWDDGTEPQMLTKLNGNHVLEKCEAMEALILSSYLIQTVWNKLYKTDIVKSLCFPRGKIHEDEFWSWQAIGKASRVATIERPLYYYRQRSNSIMDGGYVKDRLLVIEAKVERQGFIEREMSILSDIAKSDLLYTCLFHAQNVVEQRLDDKKELLHYLSSTAKQYLPSKNYMKSLPFFKRIRLWMISKFLTLVARTQRCFCIK